MSSVSHRGRTLPFCNRRWPAWLWRRTCPGSETHRAKASDRWFSCMVPTRPGPGQNEPEVTPGCLCARRRDRESTPVCCLVKSGKLGFYFCPVGLRFRLMFGHMRLRCPAPWRNPQRELPDSETGSLGLPSSASRQWPRWSIRVDGRQLGKRSCHIAAVPANQDQHVPGARIFGR